MKPRMPPGRLRIRAGHLGIWLVWLVALVQLVAGSQTVLDLDNEASISEDILLAAKNASAVKSCRSCQALLIPLKRLAVLGDDSFVSSITRICKVRKVSTPAFEARNSHSVYAAFSSKTPRYAKVISVHKDLLLRMLCDTCP